MEEAQQQRFTGEVEPAEARAIVDLTGDSITVGDLAPTWGREPTPYESMVKPAIDWFGALLLLVLTLPLTVASALAILFTMGRPVILKQQRVGQWGEVFTIYKFRTMEPDRRHQSVPFVGTDRRVAHKHPQDPRITKVGRFLRIWSLDELPQFVNVLRGEMSLVGPRPEMVEVVARYQPWQHARHSVKPGVTGLWQISERGSKAMHECTDTDLEYLDRVSFRTDMRIMVLTPLAALGLRRGF